MFADPVKNISYLHLEPGMKVADFGVGSGEYALAAAKIVGSTGRVFAIDIQKDLLDRVISQAKDRGVSGVIDGLWGDIENRGGVKLADHSVDAVIISNVLFQVESQYGVALEANRVLRPGGKIMVIDWQDSYGGIGPAPSKIITAEKVEQIFSQAGLVKENYFDAGAHHFGLIFHS